MEMQSNLKRNPGQRDENGNWLIITESTVRSSRYVHSCETEVLGVRVSHSIHDNLLGDSGGGDCHQEVVPYCPYCENKPSHTGNPIVKKVALWKKPADT